MTSRAQTKPDRERPRCAECKLPIRSVHTIDPDTHRPVGWGHVAPLLEVLRRGCPGAVR